ncbi:MAG: hypothetical protein IKU17_08030 [Clostridia bacterium]|nr:hypothetical protein [Clostridia bacterium]
MKKLFDKLFIWIFLANFLVFLAALIATVSGGLAVRRIAAPILFVTFLINAVLYFISNLSKPAKETPPESPETPPVVWPTAGAPAAAPQPQPKPQPESVKTGQPKPAEPAKPVKTAAPQAPRAPRSAAIAARDRRLSAEKVKIALKSALPFPKDTAEDNRPVFRRRLGSAVQPFFSFRHEQCSDGVWEIMQTGVLADPDTMKAEPVQRYSRQKSFGFVLGGEDLDTPYTFEKLSKDLKAECTAENWQTFLNDNDRARLEKLRAPASPLQLEPSRHAYTGSHRLQAISLDKQMRFGSQFVYLRRCGRHFRAFSINSSATNNTSLPAPLCTGGFPTEEAIDQILQTYSGQCFDRQLSWVEEDYFFAELTRAKKDDLEPVKSLYGPLPTVIKLQAHGREVQIFNGSCRYHQRLVHLIEDLAEKGASFQRSPNPRSLQSR